MNFKRKTINFKSVLFLCFRLWDAVGGFLFLFAHMQEKLSRNASQVDLLQELLNLQKDLVTMLLSMLEGWLIYFWEAFMKI
jgi:hypothetical protein